MQIKIKSILKDSLLFNIVGIITKVTMALSMIYAAKVLGPKDYGAYGLVLLWIQYIGLVKPGFVSQVTREIAVLQSNGKDFLKQQNVAISGELIFIIIPFLILIFSSFFYENVIIRNSIIILSIVIIISRINEIWSSINLVKKKFNKVATGRFIAGLIGPLLILLFIKKLGVYMLVIYSGVAALFSFIFYSLYSPINFKFTLNKDLLSKFIRDGFILQLLTISFYVYRLTDRTIISYYFSLEDLGLFTFAANLALFLKNFVGEFHTVLQPIAWGEIGKNSKNTYSSLLKTTYFIALTSLVFIPISQFIFYLITSLYLTQYIDATSVFNFLSFSTYFIAVGGTVGIILNSNTIKRYKLSLWYSCIGIFLNLIFDYLLIINGFGIIQIAIVTLIVQAFISLIQFIHVRKYFFKSQKQLYLFYFNILFPFLILVLFQFILNENLIISSLSDGVLIALFPLLIIFLTKNKLIEYFGEK